MGWLPLLFAVFVGAYAQTSKGRTGFFWWLWTVILSYVIGFVWNTLTMLVHPVAHQEPGFMGILYAVVGFVVAVLMMIAVATVPSRKTA